MATQVFTANEFRYYMQNLPSKMKKYQETIQQEMAITLASSIKNRAPSSGHSTGSLKRDIKEQKFGQGWRVVGPGHWSYVNAGVAPDKMIPVEMFEMHQANPGTTAGKSAKSVLGAMGVGRPRAWVFAGFHGGKGFVDRAFDKFEKDIEVIIGRGIGRALQK